MTYVKSVTSFLFGRISVSSINLLGGLRELAQYNFTVDDEVLKGLFSGDAGTSKLLEQVLNKVLLEQAVEQVQALPYERSEDHQGYRNGTCPHSIKTRIGTMTLRVTWLPQRELLDGTVCPLLVH